MHVSPMFVDTCPSLQDPEMLFPDSCSQLIPSCPLGPPWCLAGTQLWNDFALLTWFCSWLLPWLTYWLTVHPNPWSPLCPPLELGPLTTEPPWGWLRWAPGSSKVGTHPRQALMGYVVFFSIEILFRGRQQTAPKVLLSCAQPSTLWPSFALGLSLPQLLGKASPTWMSYLFRGLI